MSKEKVTARRYSTVLFFLSLLFCSLVLSGCDNGQVPGDKRPYINTAIGALNKGTPLPDITVDPDTIVNLKTVIFGGPLFYTRQTPPDKIQFYVINAGLTTVYVSSCEGTILQRKEGEEWLSIASVRPCGTQPNSIPLNAGNSYNLTFEFLKASVYKDQSLDVPGTYRLVVPYSLTCPSGRNDYASCIDNRWQSSSEIQLKPYPDDK